MNLFHSLKIIYQVPTICQALFLGAEDSAVNKTQTPLFSWGLYASGANLLALLQ